MDQLEVIVSKCLGNVFVSQELRVTNVIYVQTEHKLNLMDAKDVSSCLWMIQTYFHTITICVRVLSFDNIFFPFTPVRFPTGFHLQRCGNETCQFGEVCQRKTSVQGSSIFRCSCEGICDIHNNLVSPVCGNNGKTYKSECDLLKYSCEQKKHILISSYKSCHGKHHAKIYTSSTYI